MIWVNLKREAVIDVRLPDQMKTHHPYSSFQLPLTRGEIYYYLRSRVESDHERLLDRVDALRGKASLDRVAVGGEIILSSICIRSCIYCGFRAECADSRRFRLSKSEVLEAGGRAAAEGVRWMILKAAEDPGITPDVAAGLARELSETFGFTITLSLGERHERAYKFWREAGVGSYWLRHETCDPHIYRRIRPTMYWVDRLRSLEIIKEKGFRLGSGILLGVPNQSYEGLIDDLMLFLDPALFAIAIEPYLPPETCPGHEMIEKPENRIVAPDRVTMESVIAITRILRPDVIIPLTGAHQAAFQVLSDKSLFRAGANSLIVDFTPVDYRSLAGETPFVGMDGRDGGFAGAVAALSRLGLEPVFTPPL